MDDAKRRAAIRLQAAKNKEADTDPMGIGSSKPSIKRRMPSKGDRAPKKPKVSLEPVVGLMAEGVRMVTLAKHGADKGPMVASPGSQKKPPVLLREDPQYALERLSSIITSEDYEDLGNHSTEAMGEMSLFNIAQVISVVFSFVHVLCLKLIFTLFQAMLKMKGLMERCLNHETMFGLVCEKARLMRDELIELKNWKLVAEQKTKTSRTG